MGFVDWMREVLGGNSEESAREVVDDCVSYPSIDNKLVATVDRVFSPSDSNKVRVVVDVPYGCPRWNYERPYTWDETNNLVKLAEAHGYKQHTFDRLKGEAVVISPSGSRHWDMHYETPEECIREKLENGSVEPEDIPYDQLVNMGVDVPVDREETTLRTEMRPDPIQEALEDEDDVELAGQRPHPTSLTA